jgi:putative peptidoglycan lipid II flippase
LLQHGAFDAASTEWTADALVFYAIALFAHAGIEILSRGFYVLGDTRTPVGIAVGAMLLNVVLAAILVGPLEVDGLAIALSVATMLEMAGLLYLLERRIPALESLELLGAIGRMLVASGVMAMVVVGIVYALTAGAGLDVHEMLGALIVLGLAAGAGGGAYFATALLLGLTEPLSLARRLPVVKSLLR